MLRTCHVRLREDTVSFEDALSSHDDIDDKDQGDSSTLVSNLPGFKNVKNFFSLLSTPFLFLL